MGFKSVGVFLSAEKWLADGLAAVHARDLHNSLRQL